MPWSCGWKSRLALACTPPPMKTPTALILPLTLSIAPTPVVLACTWTWLAICWPFMERRPTLGQASSIITIADIPTWMGYFARWRVQCVSVSEASEIVAGCKRLEKENWRQAHWELQNRFSSMRFDSTPSAAARPFQPQATPPSPLVDDAPQAYPAQNGLAWGSPTPGLTACSPMRKTSLSHQPSSDDDGVSTDATISGKLLCKRRGSRGNRSNQSGTDSDETLTSGGR